MWLPREDWVVGDEVTVTASALTVSGALVGPVSATFVIGASEAEPVELPKLADGVGAVLSVGQDALYDAPERMWVPLPGGLAASQVELYYYVRTGETPGWYPAENVVGWMATPDFEEALIDGVRCIGIEMNHGGTVQFALRTTNSASAVGMSGGVDDVLLWLVMGAVLLVVHCVSRRGKSRAESR